MIFQFRKNICCILAPLMQREGTWYMFAEWMNFPSNEVYLPLPGKPFSDDAFVTSLPASEISEASLHLEPTFIIRGSLQFGLSSDFLTLLPARCPLGEHPAGLDRRLLPGPGEEAHTQGCRFLPCSHLLTSDFLLFSPVLTLGSLSISFQPVSGPYQR